MSAVLSQESDAMYFSKTHFNFNPKSVLAFLLRVEFELEVPRKSAKSLSNALVLIVQSSSPREVPRSISSPSSRHSSSPGW